MNEEEINTTLKQRLKLLRKEKGLTQEQLANELFVTRHTIHRWESGETQPSIDDLPKLSQIFDVSNDYLLGTSKRRKPSNSKVVGKKQVAEESNSLYDALNNIFNTDIEKTRKVNNDNTVVEEIVPDKGFKLK